MIFIFVFCQLIFSSFVDYFNVGFDVRLAESRAVPIFEYTFDEGKTYEFPENPGKSFDIPDQLYVMNKIGHKEHSVKSVYFSYKEFISEYVESSYFGLHIDVVLFAIGVDYMHEVGRVRAYLNESTNIVCLSQLQYELVKLQLASPSTMTKSGEFQQFVDNMPTAIKTERDVKIFTEFMVQFGTHYYSTGTFGGRIHFDSKVNKTYVYKKTEDFTATQLDLMFRYKMIELAPGFFVNRSQIHIDAEFRKNSESHMYFVGGDEQYQTESTLDKWLNSIVVDPAMIDDITLNPITDLIEDANKKAALKSAIDQYIKTGVIVAS